MEGILLVFIVLIIIGLVTAFVGSIMGLGGGIILVPAMLLMASLFDAFDWVTPQAIVGVSLIVMIVTGLSSTLAYLKVKRVDYKTGLLFLIGSIPGSILGSWLNQFVDGDAFQLYFGILMILISILLFLRKDGRPQKELTGGDIRTFEVNGIEYRYKVQKSIAIILALIVGMLSGLFGIGGGSIMVPAMILFFGFPVHIATATSMFMIFFASIFGSITHIALGHIPWEYVLFFIPGAWFGGKLGAKVNQKLSSKTLEWILRGLLILIGLRMIIEGVG